MGEKPNGENMLTTPINSLKTSDLSHGMDIISTSGVMGCSTTYHVQFYLMSKPFLIGNDKFFLLKTLHGTIKMKNMTNVLEKLGVTEDEIDEENSKVLKNCFNQNSENFAFNQSSLDDFLSDDPNLIQVKPHKDLSQLVDLQKFCLEHSIELNTKDKKHSAKIFSSYFNDIQDDFLKGLLPECETIKDKLIGLTA